MHAGEIGDPEAGRSHRPSPDVPAELGDGRADASMRVITSSEPVG
ncbi:hypothetical protein [Nocardiopsis sp. NRRL B-16309]|nr:hypothetical protein [Nocardiopsis sp. NRRL B-16309]